VLPEGHDALGCDVVLRGPDGRTGPFTRMRPGEPWTDRWYATVQPDADGSWTFTVEAWSDPYLTWRDAVQKKIAAGQGTGDLASELADGARSGDRREAGTRGMAGTGASRRRALADPTCPLFARVSPPWTCPRCSGSTRSGNW